jgi:hypothetical protein
VLLQQQACASCRARAWLSDARRVCAAVAHRLHGASLYIVTRAGSLGRAFFTGATFVMRMKSRNGIVVRLGLSALLTSGLLFAPGVAWGDDGGVDASDDGAVVADASLDLSVDSGSSSDAGGSTAGTGGSNADAASPSDGGGAGQADAGAHVDGGAGGATGSDGGSDAGAKAGSGGPDAGAPIPEDDAGCSTAGTPPGSMNGLLALLGAGLALVGAAAARRRRARR